jgi:hypothetical protein
MGYGATALGAIMGVHLAIRLFMLMMQGSYVFSGKEEVLVLVLVLVLVFFRGPHRLVVW